MMKFKLFKDRLLDNLRATPKIFTNLYKKFNSNLKTFVKIWLPILAFWISLIALYNSCQARRDVRAIEGLGLKPDVKLTVEFRQIKNIPPHLTIKNFGPNEAIQVVLQFNSLRYFPSQKKILIALTLSDWKWEIPELKPLQELFIELPQSLLGKTTRMVEPLHHNVLELSLRYLRNPDRKEFRQSAYYFINPEGSWVNERAIQVEQYKEVKEAVFKQKLPKIDLSFGYDPLHPINY